MRNEAVAISVGGRVLRFEPVMSASKCVVVGVAESFVVDPRTDPSCVIQCEFGEPTPNASPIVAEAPPVWELRRSATGAEEVTFFAVSGEKRGAFAQLVLDPSHTSARMIRRADENGGDVFRIGFPLDEFLMCRLVTAEGALVVHGAAVEWDARALLFIGHSGAGKSTMARLAEQCGARVLSDDRSLIRLNADGATVWGTPWHGSLRSGFPTSAPLAGIFLLTQSTADRVEILDGSRACGELLVRLIYPGASPKEFESLVDVAFATATRVPVAELFFRPTPAAFRLAQRFAAAQVSWHPALSASER